MLLTGTRSLVTRVRARGLSALSIALGEALGPDGLIRSRQCRDPAACTDASRPFSICRNLALLNGSGYGRCQGADLEAGVAEARLDVVGGTMG